MTSTLRTVAEAMVAPGRGILAADESSGTANARFSKLGIPQTAELRRQYRELLFTSADLGRWISGAILYDETLRQADTQGTPLADVLKAAGILAGIKVDTGTLPLELGDGIEKVTAGLDGLAQRVSEYVGLGATFAKWRAVIAIGDGIPSARCLHVNAHALARYAAICQAGGLVPIVEPEILMDGDHADHDIDVAFAVQERVLTEVFSELAHAGVAFEGMVLKPSMVVPGQKSSRAATSREIAEATVTNLLRRVPAAVAGIAFLSGGQGDIEATVNLNEINRVAKERGAPWPLTFSFGRALQAPAIAAWLGNGANVRAAQGQLLHRAQMNGMAALGEYTEQAEGQRALVPA
jgi:fructose-bisphosphate aldolase class I